MRPRPLTELAQQAVQAVLHDADRAIDATVGNGHDTLFLARRVAPEGRVIGFDVQAAALDNTHARLRTAGLAPVVTLLLQGHEDMTTHLPPDWPGRVGAVMFNLGYLPGGDKRLVTRAASTLAALNQAASLLRIGGLISVMVYRGHPGGADEAAAVAARLDRLDARFRVSRHESAGPLLYLVERRR